MALYMETSPGVFVEWTGQVIGDVRYPANWDRDALIELGLFDPVVPNVPAGKHVVSTEVKRVAGVVKYVYTLEDDDEDTKYPPLEKWKFLAIIELAGLSRALASAIDDIPDPMFKAVAKAKLADPPGGTYTRSDALFHNAYLQMRLNMTDEEINALWLQAGALT